MTINGTYNALLALTFRDCDRSPKESEVWVFEGFDVEQNASFNVMVVSSACKRRVTASTEVGTRQFAVVAPMQDDDAAALSVARRGDIFQARIRVEGRDASLELTPRLRRKQEC